jgi:hypothetical protein
MPATAGEPCGLPRYAVAGSLNKEIIQLRLNQGVKTRAQMFVQMLDPRRGCRRAECLQSVTGLSFDDMNQ